MLHKRGKIFKIDSVKILKRRKKKLSLKVLKRRRRRKRTHERGWRLER